MDKNITTAGAKQIINNHMLDLKIQWEKHEISQPYDAEEIKACLKMEISGSGGSKDIGKIKGSQDIFESVVERRIDVADYAQGWKLIINQDSLDIAEGFQGQKSAGSHNAVFEGSRQCKDTSSNPISWLDAVLTITAGMLIGIAIFGAFLY